jgi:uncharacterized DUF497 family protein
LDYFFEWDPKKAKSNNRKHGVSFERAATIFRDQRALSIFDDEHGIEEDRWVTLGMDSSGILLVACHTFEEETKDSCRIRIFSARKAKKKEMKQYEGYII